MSAPSAREMLDNAQEAVRRITSGMAPMRIPADPADADRVLSVLATRVEAVLALHCEFKVYDAIDPADFSDATYLYTCCRECHTDDGETNEWSDEGEWPCATVRALNGKP